MTHTDWCEAELDHDHDCSIATELARLRAFATAVQLELACTNEADVALESHVDDCLHCFAGQCLERPPTVPPGDPPGGGAPA